MKSDSAFGLLLIGWMLAILGGSVWFVGQQVVRCIWWFGQCISKRLTPHDL